MPKKLTIQKMHEIAKSKGGKFLSEQYLGANTKHQWQCDEGHTWYATPANVQFTSWCLECYGRKRGTQEGMIALAATKHGKFLSKEYLGANKKHQWECSLGHTWHATPGSVKDGTWCPRCANSGNSTGEKICREIFESIFSKIFIKSKPSWLMGLELDGYCEEIEIAFEYHGHQHYRASKGIFGGEKAFADQIKRDELKIDLCSNKVKLIVIPFFDNLNNIKNCIKCVETILKLNNITIPDWNREKSFFYIYSNENKSFSGHEIESMEKILKEKNGKLLSENIANRTSLLQWRCECGNVWNAPWHRIIKGGWCFKCDRASTGKLKRKTVDDMKILAEKKGGKFLSNEYTNALTKHKWECSEGHQWMAKPNHIQQGQWCPSCYNIKRANKFELTQKQALRSLQL